ncbi:MAG: Glu/Leu/Phe/Val dehydrogenase [candidate division Zixibacteria bacterium]|nr:Glu/Leu/Phe/Val dehydrogenase [candidate division Zixibacteria bacterium]
MIDSLIKQWDGENVIIRHDKPTGAWIIIAVHSTHLGPAVGGTRMKSYSDLEAALTDALRLAEGMTYKFAVPALPYGGGKAVIAIPPDIDEKSRADLLRRHGALIHQLGGLFMTGPDVGISSADMDIIAETGDPYVHSRTEAAGGKGSPGPFTALGVFTGVQVACENLFDDPSLKGRRILVQGTGSVGGGLIELLGAAGAKVLFSEVAEDAIKYFRDEVGLEFVLPENLYTTECDIFAPCALGGILSYETISQLDCKAVVGGANNQFAVPKDADSLQARGILYAPDYVINIGGAMAIMGMETRGWTRDQAEEEVAACVRNALVKVFELAQAEGITTAEAAHRIAELNLSMDK